MSFHKHKYTIADEEAVQMLVNKLVAGGPHQQRRDKLLKALDQAAQSHGDSNLKLRQGFFHGLLTAMLSP